MRASLGCTAILNQFLVARELLVRIVWQYPDKQRCGTRRLRTAACGDLGLNGVAGAWRSPWFRLLMTSSLASWMSVPTSNERLTHPAPRVIQELISVRPGVFLRTFSCGSTMTDSISSGAAARQKFWIDTCGCSIVGNKLYGQCRNRHQAEQCDKAQPRPATEGQCLVLSSVMFIPTPECVVRSGTQRFQASSPRQTAHLCPIRICVRSRRRSVIWMRRSVKTSLVLESF